MTSSTKYWEEENTSSLSRVRCSLFQSSHLGGLRLERLTGLVGLASLLGGLGDLDDLEGLSCGLNVDLFVRWERGGGGEREKERKRGEEKLRRATKGTGKKKTLLSRVCCLLSSNLLTLAGFALSASPASSAFAA